jgi:hypothetical protein
MHTMLDVNVFVSALVFASSDMNRVIAKAVTER